MKSGALMDVQARRQGELRHAILLSLFVNIAILLCVGGAGVTGGKEKVEECEKSHSGVCGSRKHRDWVDRVVLKYGYPSCKGLREMVPGCPCTAVFHRNKVPMKNRNQAPNTQRPVGGLKRLGDKSERPLLLVPWNHTHPLSKRCNNFRVCGKSMTFFSVSILWSIRRVSPAGSGQTCTFEEAQVSPGCADASPCKVSSVRAGCCLPWQYGLMHLGKFLLTL